MQRLVAALLIAATVWAGWWWIAASQGEAEAEAWLEERRDAGWLAETGSISTTGFPLQYTHTLTGVELADPATGWAWAGDTVTLSRPRHPQLDPSGLVVILPPEQVIRTPQTRLMLTSERFGAELDLQGPENTIARAEIQLGDIRAEADTGWQFALEEGSILATADPERPAVMQVEVAAQGWTPPAPLLAALSEAQIAPGDIGRLRIVADAGFDQAWTIAALEDERPQPEWIDISDAGLTWGALELRVAGQLMVGEEGQVEGELLVKATNWREMLLAAQASGALSEGVARGIETALDLASRFAGSSSTLDIPLSFVDGRTRLGPVRIGQAPRIVLP